MGWDGCADGLIMLDQRHNTRRTGYLNGILTVIAVLLALQLVDRQVGLTAPSPASAQVQPEDPATSAQSLVSASEQRKQMIAELRRIAGRIERIESKISAGLSVRVTEMPATKPDAKP